MPTIEVSPELAARDWKRIKTRVIDWLNTVDICEPCFRQTGRLCEMRGTDDSEQGANCQEYQDLDAMVQLLNILEPPPYETGTAKGSRNERYPFPDGDRQR